MLIRGATSADWPAIWPFFCEIARAGDTYAYPPDIDEDAARAIWMTEPPEATVVAVDEAGQVLGSARMGPNKMGGGAHISTAGFMVSAAASGRGVGRALALHALEWARAEGYRGMQFNAVVETNTRAVALWKALGFEIIGTVPEGFRLPDGQYVGLHIMYQKL